MIPSVSFQSNRFRIDDHVTDSNISSMKLSAYIQTFPRQQRVAIRQKIAQATGVTEPAVCFGVMVLEKFRVGVCVLLKKRQRVQ
jgi:hypothetical protein